MQTDVDKLPLGVEIRKASKGWTVRLHNNYSDYQNIRSEGSTLWMAIKNFLMIWEEL